MAQVIGPLTACGATVSADATPGAASPAIPTAATTMPATRPSLLLILMMFPSVQMPGETVGTGPDAALKPAETHCWRAVRSVTDAPIKGSAVVSVVLCR